MQAAREEEAANRRSMAGQDAFEELKRMAAATIAATPLGLRGAAAPAGAGAKVEAEASTSGTGKNPICADADGQGQKCAAEAAVSVCGYPLAFG